MKIVEDGVDINDIPFGFDDDDDAPTIAEITYDDEKLKAMDEYEKIKKNWKSMNEGNNDSNKLDMLKKQTNIQESSSEKHKDSLGKFDM